MMTLTINDLINEEERDKIRREREEEKEIEERIKNSLEEVQDWYEIESRLIEEKRKVLKLYEQEVRKTRSEKVKEVSDTYGIRKCDAVRKKYNISS